VKIEYAIPRRKVEQELRRYVTRLITNHKEIRFQKILLFGSYAKNNYSHGSDVDILIIADNLPRNLSERYAIFKESMNGLDLEPFSYSSMEWKNMVRTNSSFAHEIIKYGFQIYPRFHSIL
jgi:predicted nucleotidyltransferase